MITLVACNAVYGLEETRLRPPDLDGDGIFDEADNCPSVGNADQVDEDGDGFGDACDGCLGMSTATNHDEDRDGRGDICDLCPTVADLDEDLDGDGVGDRCEQQPGMTSLAHFDAFAMLAPSWQSRGVPWRLVDDAIAPIEATQLDDPGITNATLTIEGAWYAEIGILSKHVWRSGERFGLALVDGNGAELASCDVVCNESCEIVLQSGAMMTRGPVLPIAAGTIRLIDTAPGRLTCLGMGTVATITGSFPTAGAFVIHGAPAVRVTHFAVWSLMPE